MIFTRSLFTRFITACLGILILLATTYFGGANGLYILFTLIVGILTYETGLLTLGDKKRFLFLIPFHFIWFFILFKTKNQNFLIPMVTLEIIIWFWISQVKTKETNVFFNDHNKLYSFLFYSLICPTFVLLHLLHPNGLGASYSLLITVFLFDTGSYFGGKLLGKKIFSTKLSSKSSPSKTIEGALVGGLLSLAVILWATQSYPEVFIQFSKISNFPLRTLAITSVFIFALSGDLLESTFKRASSLKDSGSLLPGHGGVFDRLDGVLFASILSYMLLQL